MEMKKKKQNKVWFAGWVAGVRGRGGGFCEGRRSSRWARGGWGSTFRLWVLQGSGLAAKVFAGFAVVGVAAEFSRGLGIVAVGVVAEVFAGFMTVGFAGGRGSQRWVCGGRGSRQWVCEGWGSRRSEFVAVGFAGVTTVGFAGIGIREVGFTAMGFRPVGFVAVGLAEVTEAAPRG